MIIIEGPDNSGKTTLLNKLQVEHKLGYLVIPHRGPVQRYHELYCNMEYILNVVIKRSSKRYILDRLPLISESIYGPLCRKRDIWVENFEDKIRFTKALITLDPFIIYCRPPMENILDMKTHQVKEYDTEEHLAQVNRQKRNIVEAYDNYFYNWYNPYRFFIYDYTNPQHDAELNKLLKEYLKW